MSNSQAVAAVTATIYAILQYNVTTESDLSDTKVTLLPLDKARGTRTSNQLNLFLYQVQRDPAWTNMDMPPQAKNGEVNYPPLPLTLFYLLTAFGRDDDSSQPFSHELLGKAMSLLHDYPVLSAADIKAATSGIMPDSDLDQQIERVRITLHPISVDELSKLWTGFATQYRLSAAYEVGVTLIESTRSSAAPLPVLTRGPKDTGYSALANLGPVVPTLNSITPPNNQPSARLADKLTISGALLDGTNIGVSFDHPLLSTPIELAPDSGATATTLTVTLPNDALHWPAGIYGVSVFVQRSGESFRRQTNALPLSLAPSITVSPATPAAGNVSLTVTSSPQIWPGQRATLYLNDQQLQPNLFTTETPTLTFPAVTLAKGTYYTRLRVDGIDSLLVDKSASPPKFDPSQAVTVS
ncbi:MAG TPA: DUF4255 domain-containing protein [Rhizomicrobium sp.]|jgi:hypothetical protein|nr:DUF4255 domain-containing protein [Acetobacteraceae bacterium]